MIRHMVLFSLREGITVDDPRVRRACDAEALLAARFPEGNWSFGANCAERPDAAQFAGTGDFASAEALRVFLLDPKHREAGALWVELARWTVADLELP